MTDDAKSKSDIETKAPSTPQAPPAEPSHEDRVAALIAGYKRGLNANAPRTTAELTELKALLLG